MDRSESVTPTSVRSFDPARFRRLAEEAASAIAGLWDSERQTFWRSTVHRTRDKDKSDQSFFPTVTLRCLDALLFFLQQFPEWVTKSLHQQIVDAWLPSIVERDQKSLKSTLNTGASDHEGLNLFTLSLYVRTFARIASSKSVGQETRTRAGSHLASAATDLIEHPRFRTALSPTESQLHPFILYHSYIALRCALPLIDKNLQTAAQTLMAAIEEATRGCIERLAAKIRLGISNPSEPVALAFCAGVLSKPGRSEDKPYVLSSWSECCAAQDANGCWPQGRVVRKDKDLESDRLEIATYEVASVLTSSIVDVARGKTESVGVVVSDDDIQRLIRAGHYVDRSVVRIATDSAPKVGWCSDHAYGTEMIESWTSATVLESVLNLADLVSEVDRQTILAKFTIASPASRDWPKWLRWNDFRTASEVDSQFPILDYLQEKIVKPILIDPRHLPAQSPRSMSALLFGPPGTSKTTIAKAVADGLEWPVVLLSPGVFIERGLEYIEAQARAVFADLMNLSRAVVVFDECDELFREREPRPGLEQARSITAFVTASMLPKLQDLHDRGKIVFFICTNNFETMDPAVKRGGRIDHLIAVGPPDELARRRILADLRSELSRNPSWTNNDRITAVIDQIAGNSERFNRSELGRAVQILARKSMPTTDDEARSAARSIVKKMEPSLTIKPEDYSSFLEQKRQYSHVVIGDA